MNIKEKHMAKQDKLRVVMAGVCGFGGYRRARMRETGLFDLVAAYDWNAENMAKCQAEEHCEAAKSYEELIARPNVEAVIISTGGKFHAEQMIKGAERGLHVYVEKPMCSTPEELQAIIATQKKTGVVMGVGHGDHSHEAGSLAVKGMIDSGELGKIATFEKTTAHSGGLMIKPGDWRGDPAKNPGGMLFQCGVHALHELMFYFGPIAEVSAMMRYDVHTTLTADVACCILRFESGLIGTLNAYHVTPYRHTFSVFGTKSSLYRDERFFDEGTKLWMQTTHLDNQKEARVPVEIKGESDICGNLKSFYNAIRGTGPKLPYPSYIDGGRAVAAVFAAEESAKKGGAAVKVAKM